MPVPIRARKRPAKPRQIFMLSGLRFCSIAYVWDEAKRCPELLTVADPDLQIRGEGVVIRTLRKGGGGQSQKQILSALRASIWSKNKGAPGRAPPLNPPLINADVRGIYQTYFMTLFLIDLYKMENTCVCLNIIKIEPNFVSLFSIIQ